LQCRVGLLLTELVRGVGNLVGAEDLGDADFFKSVLAMPGTLILANHLRCHSVFVLLLVEVNVEGALTVSVHLDFDLFQTFLQDWFPDAWEKVHDVLEVDEFILLEESDDVRLASRLDEVLVLAGRGVVNEDFGFDLTNGVQGVKLADNDALVALARLRDRAEEVCAARGVEEDRCVVHLVFHHC